MKKIKYLLLLICILILTGCNTNTEVNNQIYNKGYDVSISITEFEDLVVAVGEKCDKGTIGVITYISNGLSLSEVATGSGFVYDGYATLRQGGTIPISEIDDKTMVSTYTYYAITNYHVIDGGSAIKVFLGSDYPQPNAKVIAKDATRDLALISFNCLFYLKPLELGNSDNVKKGQFAIAIGSPQGFDFFNTLTLGIVSYPNRVLDEEYGKNLYIQTDVAINPGNSGGPLINIKGEVIGVNTMKLVDEEIDLMGFAIPINVVKEFIKNNSK